MTFTTVQGSAATDATTFLGTAGVDSLTVQDQTAPFRVEARASGDNIVLSDFTSDLIIDDGDIFLGAGNDTLTTVGTAANNVTVVDSMINGNKGTVFIHFVIQRINILNKSFEL